MLLLWMYGCRQLQASHKSLPKHTDFQNIKYIQHSNMTDYVRRRILRYPHSTLIPKNPCLKTGAPQLTAPALTDNPTEGHPPPPLPKLHRSISEGSQSPMAQGSGMLEIFFQSSFKLPSSLRSLQQPQTPQSIPLSMPQYVLSSMSPSSYSPTLPAPQPT